MEKVYEEFPPLMINLIFVLQCITIDIYKEGLR